MHITARNAAIQYTPTFHHLCYKSHIIGGEHIAKCMQAKINRGLWVADYPKYSRAALANDFKMDKNLIINAVEWRASYVITC
ncbi:hypothetical protein SFRURICE_017405 [Spodoptera frugiperda]|uniref:SFRICE_014460 n=1 Tax=Spodoptera frugiperda TaxID=7108 RepID=A0A2H1VL08_SPOFR|nr:hypothetical protein SFRURICE_017405 [Spodoptera frugiperda]